MSNDGVDNSRRRFLTATTSVVGAVGAGFVAVPFLASWSPSERARAAGAPVQVDISKIEKGALMRVEWRGKPVWIVHRPEKALSDMASLDAQLRDPGSDQSIQPDDCKNATRSVKPEILVAVGICTHLGCSPSYRPEVAPDDLGADWRGGFMCPCHGSKFDLAGRVYQSVPAPTNLEVPPHRYVDASTLLIGDQGAA